MNKFKSKEKQQNKQLKKIYMLHLKLIIINYKKMIMNFQKNNIFMNIYKNL